MKSVTKFVRSIIYNTVYDKSPYCPKVDKYVKRKVLSTVDQAWNPLIRKLRRGIS